jgi:thioredoxin-like negative regulator of GroEL
MLSARAGASAALAAVLLAPWGPAPSSLAAAASETGAASGIPWEKSFKNAMKKARASGQPLMVDFWAEWCQWCHQLDATTYGDPAVVAAATTFVPVKVNTEGSLEEKQLSAQYDVEILPTIAFLSPRGHVILFRDKFEGPEAFAATLASARKAAGDVMGWEEMLSRRRDDASALAPLGAYLFAQRRFDESRELLERASNHDADRPTDERKRTRILLAAIQERADHHADAEKLLKGALALQPASPAEDADALLELGETYAKWGKPDSARDALTHAIETGAGSGIADQARRTLEALPRP